MINYDTSYCDNCVIRKHGGACCCSLLYTGSSHEMYVQNDYFENQLETVTVNLTSALAFDEIIKNFRLKG